MMAAIYRVDVHAGPAALAKAHYIAAVDEEDAKAIAIKHFSNKANDPVHIDRVTKIGDI